MIEDGPCSFLSHEPLPIWQRMFALWVTLPAGKGRRRGKARRDQLACLTAAVGAVGDWEWNTVVSGSGRSASESSCSCSGAGVLGINSGRLRTTCPPDDRLPNTRLHGLPPETFIVCPK